MKKLNFCFLLPALLFGLSASGQFAEGSGKNSGRSNKDKCCLELWQPVLPAAGSGAISGQERAAPTVKPLPMGLRAGPGNEKIDVTVFNGSGQAMDPRSWSLRTEGQTMLVDLSKLPEGRYTILMESGNGSQEFEIGRDGARPRLLSAWEKVEVDMIHTCGPSGTKVENCDNCPSTDYECYGKRLAYYKWGTGAAEMSNPNRRSVPSLPKIDSKQVAEIANTCSPRETTFLTYVCASGDMRKISKKSECPEGCFVVEFERSKR